MRIKLLRKKAGLTQEQLAKMVGVTQEYISKIEKGDISGITLGKLIRIAKILKITSIELSTILLKKYNVKESNNTVPNKKNLIKAAEFVKRTFECLLSESEEIFLSKFNELSEKDRRKIIKIVELFEEEEP